MYSISSHQYVEPQTRGGHSVPPEFAIFYAAESPPKLKSFSAIVDICCVHALRMSIDQRCDQWNTLGKAIDFALTNNPSIANDDGVRADVRLSLLCAMRTSGHGMVNIDCEDSRIRDLFCVAIKLNPQLDPSELRGHYPLEYPRDRGPR
jgi:hypothetical protein